MNEQRDLRRDRPRHSSTQYVDTSIGNWIVTNEDGDYALLLVKDINAFCDTLKSALHQKSLKALRQQVKELLDFVEFAQVKIKKDGTVKWNGGEFVEAAPDSSAISRMTFNQLGS